VQLSDFRRQSMEDPDVEANMRWLGRRGAGLAAGRRSDQGASHLLWCAAGEPLPEDIASIVRDE